MPPYGKGVTEGKGKEGKELTKEEKDDCVVQLRELTTGKFFTCITLL